LTVQQPAEWQGAKASLERDDEQDHTITRLPSGQPFCFLLCYFNHLNRKGETMTVSSKEIYTALTEAKQILDLDSRLSPGSYEYRVVTDSIHDQIERLGPEKALEDIRQTKAHLIGQIEFLAGFEI